MQRKHKNKMAIGHSSMRHAAKEILPRRITWKNSIIYGVKSENDKSFDKII